jgi:hypothetical protein
MRNEQWNLSKTTFVESCVSSTKAKVHVSILEFDKNKLDKKTTTCLPGRKSRPNATLTGLMKHLLPIESASGMLHTFHKGTLKCLSTSIGYVLISNEFPPLISDFHHGESPRAGCKILHCRQQNRACPKLTSTMDL